MCVTKLTSDNRNRPAVRRRLKPVQQKTYVWYRVLRKTSRGVLRSVNRDCAGRNATSVKDVELRKTFFSVVAEQLCIREGNTHFSWEVGATGVQDHSMYKRLMSKRERSVSCRADVKRLWPRVGVQGLKTKPLTICETEVRCLHSSDEAGQFPWSEGGHGK
jgi:hypothetical protein